MSGGSAPAAPNFGPVADAMKNQSALQYQMSMEQLQWAKDQFGWIKPFAERYLNSSFETMDESTRQARADRARYEDIYQPIEDAQAKAAAEWDSPERKALMAARAGATASRAFDAADAAATRELEGFGVNPADGNFKALNRGAKLQRAAATAGAMNSSDTAIDMQANALRSEAINVGRGYPGQVAQQYGTATASAGAGLAGGNQTVSTAGNALGNPLGWQALGNQSLMNSAQTMNMGHQAQMATHNANAQSSSGIGSAVGSLIGMGAMMFSDERMKENMVPVGVTPDGQTVYDFNYKGDPERHTGLIAQEVEQVHPEAVATDPASGMKMVDMARAVPGYQGGGPVAGSVIPPQASMAPGQSGDTVPMMGEVGEYIIPRRAVGYYGSKKFDQMVMAADKAMGMEPQQPGPEMKAVPSSTMQRPTFVSPGAATDMRSNQAVRRAA